MIRVLLADDHEIVRLGLRSVLEGAEDIDVVGEVATAEAAVSAAQAGGIDVILMDLRFGAGVEGTRVMGGAEATAQIRSAMATPPKVLVVTNYDTDADILGAIEAGGKARVAPLRCTHTCLRTPLSILCSSILAMLWATSYTSSRPSFSQLLPCPKKRAIVMRVWYVKS